MTDDGESGSKRLRTLLMIQEHLKKCIQQQLKYEGSIRRHTQIEVRETARTLKKFRKESSGTSGTLATDDVIGSKGPSITDELGTASSSSNSLQQMSRDS